MSLRAHQILQGYNYYQNYNHRDPISLKSTVFGHYYSNPLVITDLSFRLPSCCELLCHAYDLLSRNTRSIFRTLDTVGTACVAHGLYYYLITNFGNPEALTIMTK